MSIQFGGTRGEDGYRKPTHPGKARKQLEAERHPSPTPLLSAVRRAAEKANRSGLDRFNDRYGASVAEER